MESVLHLESIQLHKNTQTASSKTASNIVIGIFIATTGACLMTGSAGMLRLIYPILGVLAALFLYSRRKASYVGFVIWMWFLSPFVRRLADQMGGFQETSPILLTPYLVTAVSALLLLRHIRELGKPRNLPFVFALTAIIYGTVVGLSKFSLVQMLPALLNWLAPVLFAFLLVECHKQYDEIKRSIESSFLYGTLLMGLYSVYQFFFLPEWDRLWLQNMKTTTFGIAEPMQIRGFSTMNAPVIFGLTIMAMLIVVLGMKSRLRFLAGACGFAGLVLSLNRSAWLGAAAGAILVIWRMGMKERLRIVTALAVCAIFLPAILVVPGMSDLVADKVQSFASISNDTSFQARVEGYTNATTTLASEPFGEGVGSPDIDHKTIENDDAIGPHDSVFLELLYSLGWFGSACYLCGIVIMIVRGSSSHHTKSHFTTSMLAVSVAFIAQCLLNDIVYGGVGLIFWIGAAMPLAAIAHASHESAMSEVVPARRPNWQVSPFEAAGGMQT